MRDHDTVTRIEPFRTSIAEMLLDGRLTVPIEDFLSMTAVMDNIRLSVVASQFLQFFMMAPCLLLILKRLSVLIIIFAL